MFISDPFSTAKEEFTHRPIVKPNTQYLWILYRLYTTYEETWLRELQAKEAH